MDALYVSTRIFAQPAAGLMSRALGRWLTGGKYFMFAVPLIVCAILGATVRWEWLLVGLAITLLIYPFLLFLVYFKVGLKPETAELIQPMECIFSPNELALRFYKISREDEGNGETTVKYLKKKSVNISYTQITRVNERPKRLILYLNLPRYGSICINDNDWREPAEKKEAIKYLRDSGTQFAEKI